MIATPIGITQRYVPATSYDEQRDGLDRRWQTFLAACGLAAVPLPNVPELAVRNAELFEVAGIILSGGEDLEAYGGPPCGRDETDAALLAWATSRGRPVLGICRGAQFLLAHYGTPLDRVEGHVGTTHQIDGFGLAPCYHTLGARTTSLPPALVCTAAVDDVVEAFAVGKTTAPVVGIMAHPERVEPPDSQHVDVVARLFANQP